MNFNADGKGKNMSGVGHNSGGIAGERLQSFIERIERLAEEKDALTGDIREVYSEAKGNGFDIKIMRQLIRRRKMDKADRQEQDALLEAYERALGDFIGTPLGQAGRPFDYSKELPNTDAAE